jgi:hypothetical protein
MSQKVEAKKARTKQRRISLLIGAIIVAIIVVLIKLEHIAILYALATLGVCALLVIVALSDLGEGKTPIKE